jgi:hypothetical protein
MKRLVLPSLLGVLLALGVTACGVDDTSLEAQLEKARIAIDAGDYATAEAIVEALCPSLASCSDDLIALLAEAQMGLGGVDLLNLLSSVEDLVIVDNTEVFDVVDAMFGTDGVDATAVADLLDAIATLQALAAPTATDQLQLAIASTAHLVASVMLATDPDNDDVYNTGGVDATLAATVTTDLNVVLANAQAVETFLGVNTEVTDDLEALRDQIEGAGADGTVTAAELSTFVGTL